MCGCCDVGLCLALSDRALAARVWCCVCLVCSGFLHVPLEEYRSNLESMIDKMRNKGIKDILVIIPPPVRGSTAASRAEVVSDNPVVITQVEPQQRSLSH